MPAQSWTSLTWRLGGCAAIALLLGWWLGSPMAGLLAALLAWSGWQLFNLLKLQSWLQDHESEPPESIGLWARVFDRINWLENRHRRQHRSNRDRLAGFQGLTDALPDATVVIDESENIVWSNNAAVELLGLKLPEDLGQCVTNLVRGPDFADWLAVQDEISSKLEMPSPRDDNTWLTVSAVPLRKGQRLLILRDNTEVHQLDTMRRDFVANVSHELRTPLTVLTGYLEMLSGHPSGDVAQATERMQDQTRQMQDMLDDLLELSRLQSLEVTGAEAAIDVPALLAQLKEQAEELGRGTDRGKGPGRRELHFEVQDGLWLNGIATDIESAFRNLIMNAVHYTDDGGSIQVTWSEGPDGPCLSVADDGIGIPRRDLPRLTERFYRVGADRARHTGGTGLGLAIVKHVLQAHQAQLHIESELGEGSTFSCQFPPERAQHAARARLESNS